MEDEEQREQEVLKHILDFAKTSPEDFSFRELYGGEVTYLLDKRTGFIHKIMFFKGTYYSDFITKEAAQAIAELAKEFPA